VGLGGGGKKEGEAAEAGGGQGSFGQSVGLLLGTILGSASLRGGIGQGCITCRSTVGRV